MSRYRFTVEFESDGGEGHPGEWMWPELVDIDSHHTTADWSTWNVEEA
jgi:hypothetical protein